MELLFNKQGADFSAEIKEALGFIDADFPYKKIKADLRTATSDLIKVIGKTTYEEILGFYKDGTDVDEEKEMLELAQYAVATAAYRLFAPANDLQDGKNGRKMLTSDDSKTPFEHMLVASNDELERRSFRAMNDVLALLDAQSNTWKASDEYKASHKLFVRTVDEFNVFWSIDSRLLLIKLQPGLSLAEKREIVPRITSTVYKTLKDKRDGTSEVDLTETEKTLLPLIQEACVYSALSWGIPRLQTTLFPEGILQPVRGDRQTVTGRIPYQGNQVDQMAQLFRRDADRVLLEIEKLLEPTEEEAEANPKTELDSSQTISFDEDSNFVST